MRYLKASAFKIKNRGSSDNSTCGIWLCISQNSKVRETKDHGKMFKVSWLPLMVESSMVVKALSAGGGGGGADSFIT